MLKKSDQLSLSIFENPTKLKKMTASYDNSCILVINHNAHALN